MRRLNYLSIALTVAGVVALALGLLLDLAPVIALVGLMLIVAGVVKVATVRIWHVLSETELPPPGR